MSQPRRQLRSRWTRVEGLPVHARVSADSAPGSPPVVLVHGIGVASRFMVPIAELLAPHHPVYAPDLPVSARAQSRPARRTSSSWPTP